MTDIPKSNNPTPDYDSAFAPAFQAGINRLSKAEVKYLDDAITPEIAFLLAKAFGPDMGILLWPLIAKDSPATVKKA